MDIKGSKYDNAVAAITASSGYQAPRRDRGVRSISRTRSFPTVTTATGREVHDICGSPVSLSTSARRIRIKHETPQRSLSEPNRKESSKKESSKKEFSKKEFNRKESNKQIINRVPIASTDSGSSNDYNWRRASSLPINGCVHDQKIRYHPNGTRNYAGHYGFGEEIHQFPKYHSKHRGKSESTPLAKKNEIPNTTIVFIPYIGTPQEAQEMVDKLNKSKPMISCSDLKCCSKGEAKHVDPHYCCSDDVCSMEAKRTKKDPVSGEEIPDYRWGNHRALIDFEFAMNSKHISAKDEKCIIMPSWHSSDVEKWFSKYNTLSVPKKESSVPCPLHGYDMDIIRDTTIGGYIRQMTDKHASVFIKNSNKRLYFLVNLFGKDPHTDDVSDSEYNCESLQLVRGVVEPYDLTVAGIGHASFRMPEIAKNLIDAAKIGGCREAYEETDKRINIKYDDPHLNMINDIWQPNKDDGKRVVVFMYSNPTGLSDIITK
jgi:hypothetical protein